MPYAYLHPRPALTVDCAVFGFDAAELKVLLITRKLPPFRNRWALPGGFVRIEETLDDAARRELAEETGLKRVFLEQLYTFGATRRDPRERVVSVAYYALVPLSEQAIRAATDASDAAWFPATRTPALAFDHAEILSTALRRLRAKVRYQPIGFELLPPRFTLSQLQHLYEAVLETEFDKRNFRKRILGTGLLVALSERVRVGAHRPARLFRFDTATYEKLIKGGFNFEL